MHAVSPGLEPGGAVLLASRVGLKQQRACLGGGVLSLNPKL